MEIIYKIIGLSVFWAILTTVLFIALFLFWDWNVKNRTLTFQLYELFSTIWKFEIKKHPMSDKYAPMIIDMIEKEMLQSRKFLFGNYYRNLIKRKTQC